MANVLVTGKLHPGGRALLNVAPGMMMRYIEEISEESYALISRRWTRCCAPSR